MGYYNDVRICMKQDNFYIMIEQARPKGFTEHNYMLDETKMNITKFKDGTVIFGWNDIKWEEDFTDVAFVLEFLDRMREEGHPYAFVRIGYDLSDNEEYYYDGKEDDDICHKIELERKIYEYEEEDEND